jgi:molecular chaperone GrpE (heat shock protein)
MNESTFSNEREPESAAVNDPPQFGLLDVVEAFTAMRHEWRNQSKENRELAQSMQASADLLNRIDSTLDQKLIATTANGGLQKLIGLVIDLDISLTRAVDASSNSAKSTRQTGILAAVESSYEQLGFFSRTFSRKFYKSVVNAIQNESVEPDPTVEGVRLVHSRLRRMIAEQDLARVETVGKTFDGETMKAISTVESDQHSLGIVAHEITPAYYYRGQLVRVAEVRVAK